MKKLTHPLRRMLDLAQRRFIRSRSGSVLILVVALLVLMALIGTAFMTMAQFDRVAAVQHSANTEVDLLVEGVINQIKGVINGDLFVNGSFRPAVNTAVTPTPAAYNTNVAGAYNYYNGIGYTTGSAQVTAGAAPGDWWLASRTPDLIGSLLVSGSGTTPAWGFLTGALNGSGTFDTPYWPSGTPVRYPTRTILMPGALAIPSQTAQLPAWISEPTVGTVMAADADGDGIADSGLVKLLTLEGITYYAAVRIVDNAAAVNASIATRPNPIGTYTANTALPGDFSPANLDLEGMTISNSTELYGAGLLNYRFNAINPGTGGIDENGNARGDFNYMLDPLTGINLAYTQQWMQLGRRLDNPGNITTGTTSASKYQALAISESMSMARNFILHDSSVTSAATSSSVLEQRLPTTIYAASPALPYIPSDTVNWYNNNFNYAAGVNTNMPMRALLVARNPVSNFAPTKFKQYSTGAYNFGDMIKATPTGTTGSSVFVCINPGTATPPLLASGGDPNFQDPNWAYEPWSTPALQTKTNANTASFQQLYAAYWAVMADQFTAGVWQPAYPTGGLGAMFRNPIRKTGTVLTQAQVMYLRAAIAAVNTMQLRQSPINNTTYPYPDVISRTITIPGTAYKATIYGAEKQPYITQVIARNDVASGDPTMPNSAWVGIEVYNPFPTPIIMTNDQFVSLNRGTMALSVIAPVPATTIPAMGRVVFVSDTGNPNVMMPAAAAGATILTVANLASKGLGTEILLMRPRRYDGNVTTSTLLNNIYKEAITGTAIDDLVPIDSYDFSNLPVNAGTAADIQQWEYARPSAGAAKSWHFVYPGPWNGTAAAPVPTEGGTSYKPAPMMTDATSLGTAQAAVASAGPLSLTPYLDVPLQVNNVDFGGPLKVTAATNNYFPFGGFARNADILQVTFVGSYKIFTGDDTAQTILEINTLPSDSSMATAIDTTPYTPIGTSAIAAENIGRFCPIDKTDGGANYDDFGTDQTKWRYHWATRLFDYLTVQCPQDDYLPEVDPWHVEPTSTVAPSPAPFFPTAFKYLPAAGGTALPNAVANVTGGVTNGLYPNLVAAGVPTFNINNATEETAPVNGLVNINTAPWRVLSAVPWVPGSVANYQNLNALVAQAIVYYRDVDDGSATRPHGPFKSIFELNDVRYPKGATTLLRDFLGNAAAYQSPQYGYLSPIVPTPATAVAGDFEMQFQTLARVSNMITTRSDSFTAYVLVQGWRNAETNNPTLIVQRRAAVIIDRSVVTPSNSSPNATNIPMN